MTIQNLTPAEQAARVAMYMKRSLSDMRTLATLNGIDPAGMTRAQIAAAIVANSRRADAERTPFDMTGLYIRTA